MIKRAPFWSLCILDTILQAKINLISREPKMFDKIRGFSCPRCHFQVILDSSDFGLKKKEKKIKKDFSTNRRDL
jgi:hypothetical protein